MSHLDPSFEETEKLVDDSKLVSGSAAESDSHRPTDSCLGAGETMDSSNLLQITPTTSERGLYRNENSSAAHQSMLKGIDSAECHDGTLMCTAKKNASEWMMSALFGWPAVFVSLVMFGIIAYRIDDSHQWQLLDLAQKVSISLTYLTGALLQRYTSKLSNCRTTLTRLLWMFSSLFGLRFCLVCSISGTIIIWLILHCCPMPAWVWELDRICPAHLRRIVVVSLELLVAILIIWLPRKDRSSSKTVIKTTGR